MHDIALITTCKRRLHHIKQTLPLMVAQGANDVVVVDYACPDGTGDWVEANFPEVKVVRVTDDPGFCTARARNAGAAATEAKWLAFIDADVITSAGWLDWMHEHVTEGHFYRAGLKAGKRCMESYGTSICTRADFEAIGGFDEMYTGWGGEDDDLYDRLRLHGITERNYPKKFVSAIPHGDDERAGWSGQRNKSEATAVLVCYRNAKLEAIKAFGLQGDLPIELRTSLMTNTTQSLAQWFEGGGTFPISLSYQVVHAGLVATIRTEYTGTD